MYDYEATVTNVVDGDTVDATVRLGFLLTATLRLRLLGVNCPEVHGATRDAGLAAKAFTSACLLGKSVVIHTEKGDSFGRWLARVYLADGTDFCRSLIDHGHAVPFMVGRAAAVEPGEDD